LAMYITERSRHSLRSSYRLHPSQTQKNHPLRQRDHQLDCVLRNEG
jgi:hypothetical protein